MAETQSMNVYEDSIVAIDDHHLKLKNFLLPFTSSITLDFDEIVEVEVVRLKPLARINLLGTQDFETWWTFDPKRLLKNAGFVVKFAGGRFRVGFTVDDFHAAFTALASGLGSRLHDRRYRLS